MNIQLELMPGHWWIEATEIYKKPKITCQAMVRFKTADGEHEVRKEKQFETLQEATEWVEEQLQS